MKFKNGNKIITVNPEKIIFIQSISDNSCRLEHIGDDGFTRYETFQISKASLEIKIQNYKNKINKTSGFTNCPYCYARIPASDLGCPVCKKIQPKRPQQSANVYNSYVQYTILRLNKIDQTETLRDILDICKPGSLHSCLTRGYDQALQDFPNLDPKIKQALRSCLSKAVRRLISMKEEWKSVDNYERKGLLNILVAGAFSKQTKYGKKIGEAFYPGEGEIIGAAIGATIGTMIAAAKIEKEADIAVNKFQQTFEEFTQAIDRDFKELVEPLL